MLKLSLVAQFWTYMTWECANTGDLLSVKLFDPYNGGRFNTVGLPLRFSSGVTPGRAIGQIAFNLASEAIVTSVSQGFHLGLLFPKSLSKKR